jgi:hypothetical protein
MIFDRCLLIQSVPLKTIIMTPEKDRSQEGRDPAEDQDENSAHPIPGSDENQDPDPDIEEDPVLDEEDLEDLDLDDEDADDIEWEPEKDS